MERRRQFGWVVGNMGSLLPQMDPTFQFVSFEHLEIEVPHRCISFASRCRCLIGRYVVGDLMHDIKSAEYNAFLFMTSGSTG